MLAFRPHAMTREKTFFGHPRGLAYLAFTEAWERFSFYGMQGLLLLYMLQKLLTPEVQGRVIGLAGFRGALESVVGPLSNQAFASQTFGLYSGLVYFTPVFGGILADRWLGKRRTVMVGAIVMSAVHLVMALDAGFIIALLLLICGTGMLKGNISAQVGHLYPADDEARRTRAFAIFSAAINFGALLGPLTCGILAQRFGWHVGFATAGVLMLTALATYVAGQRHLPADQKKEADAEPKAKLTKRDWKVIAALLALNVIGVAPQVAYYQSANSGLLFIETSVDRGLFGWTMPTSAFNSLDGFFCIVFVPVLFALWRWQAKRGGEPGDTRKIAIGYLLSALANVVLLWPASRADHGGVVSVAWPIANYAINALGFLYFWPTTLALCSRSAPASVNSTMMGLMFFQLFAGNVVVGVVGGLWEKMSHASFFGLHVLFGLIPCVLMALSARWLSRVFTPA